jgi:hypothetical protein
VRGKLVKQAGVGLALEVQERRVGVGGVVEVQGDEHVVVEAQDRVGVFGPVGADVDPGAFGELGQQAVGAVELVV